MRLACISRFTNGRFGASPPSHYSPDDIEGWVVPATDENLRWLALNRNRGIRLVAELDGEPVGIGALVLEESAVRAVYVAPESARRGCGSALVREMERIARNHGLARLTLHASLNAERFYANLGFDVLERTEKGTVQRPSLGGGTDGEGAPVCAVERRAGLREATD